jgi:hypothetical protein
LKRGWPVIEGGRLRSLGLRVTTNC